MGLGSDLPIRSPRDSAGEFYPMASGKPFTPIARGGPGDPHFHPEAHTQVASLSEGVHQSLNELSRQITTDPDEIKRGVKIANTLFGILFVAWIYANMPQITNDYLNESPHPLITLAKTFISLALVAGYAVSADTDKVEIIGRKLALREKLREPSLPNHPCQMKLTDDVFNACMRSKQLPEEIIDPITKDIVEDPVMFLNNEDATMTVFSRESAEDLLKRNMEHPITRKRIVRAELVELPELKSQIEKLKGIQNDQLP